MEFPTSTNWNPSTSGRLPKDDVVVFRVGDSENIKMKCAPLRLQIMNITRQSQKERSRSLVKKFPMLIIFPPASKQEIRAAKHVSNAALKMERKEKETISAPIRRRAKEIHYYNNKRIHALHIPTYISNTHIHIRTSLPRG